MLNLALDLAPVKRARFRDGGRWLVLAEGGFDVLQFGQETGRRRVAGGQTAHLLRLGGGQFGVQERLQFQFQIGFHSKFSRFKPARRKAMRRRA